MQKLSRDYKRKLGALLLSLSRNEFTGTGEAWKLAKVLEARGLARFIGPEPKVGVVSPQEYLSRMHAAALSRYVLSPAGEDFVHRHTERQLLEGHFLMPDEPAWHQHWFWTLIWPSCISMITAIITAAITTYLLGVK